MNSPQKARATLNYYKYFFYPFTCTLASLRSLLPIQDRRTTRLLHNLNILPHVFRKPIEWHEQPARRNQTRPKASTKRVWSSTMLYCTKANMLDFQPWFPRLHQNWRPRQRMRNPPPHPPASTTKALRVHQNLSSPASPTSKANATR